MSGPTRKPFQLRSVEGGRGHHRPMVPDLEAPRGGLIAPPGLSKEERAAWEQHVVWLEDLKIDSRVDAGELLLAITHFVRARRADRVIARKGLTYKCETANGEMIRPRPEIRISAESTRLYNLIIGKFGMSPADRAKLSLDRPGEEDGAGDTPAGLNDADEPGA